MALAMMLLAGAGLLMKSFTRLIRVDPGFRVEKALTFRISLPPSAYAQEPRTAFYEELLARLGVLPGVRSTGGVWGLPLGGNKAYMSFGVEGRPPLPPAQKPSMQMQIATADYFRTMEIPVTRGRGFQPADRAGAPQVVLLSDTAVRRFFPGEDPIGKRLKVGGASSPRRSRVSRQKLARRQEPTRERNRTSPGVGDRADRPERSSNGRQHRLPEASTPNQSPSTESQRGGRHAEPADDRIHMGRQVLGRMINDAGGARIADPGQGQDHTCQIGDLGLRGPGAIDLSNERLRGRERPVFENGFEKRLGARTAVGRLGGQAQRLNGNPEATAFVSQQVAPATDARALSVDRPGHAVRAHS
jgi:hypothetical protein